jgi:hypothetical protein
LHNIKPIFFGAGSELHGIAVHDALKKINQVCRSPGLGRNQLTLKFPPLVIHVVITLLFNDHVMHDHPCYLPRYLLAPCSNRVPSNSAERLQQTKWPLHILPSSFLLFSKSTPFPVFRDADCLYKCRPRPLGSLYHYRTRSRMC